MDLGLLSEIYLFSSVPSSLLSRQTKSESPTSGPQSILDGETVVCGCWNLSRKAETSRRIIYISLIVFSKILTKESRVFPQLLGS